MSREPRVQLRSVHRRFGKVAVLSDVDLDVFPGEVLGLVGPNGGGKSTLLLLMAGLVSPTQGTVTVDGVPADQLATARTGSVGLITADAGVSPLLTGWENLDFFGGLFRLSRQATRERAGPLLDELGMTEAMSRRVGEWSSGMKQKLSLVRARLLDPKVLLLDEPTANLDPLSAHTIYRTVRAEADRGLAVALVTHDLAAAESLCDRVAIVEGRIKHLTELPGPHRPPTPAHLLELFETYVEAR